MSSFDLPRRFRPRSTICDPDQPCARSARSSFTLSAANYNMYQSVGALPPAGIDVQGSNNPPEDHRYLEGFLWTRQESNHGHARLQFRQTLDCSGGKITQRGVLLFIVPHIAEHLGQLIAYARINGVVPP